MLSIWTNPKLCGLVQSEGKISPLNCFDMLSLPTCIIPHFNGPENTDEEGESAFSHLSTPFSTLYTNCLIFAIVLCNLLSETTFKCGESKIILFL